MKEPMRSVTFDPDRFERKQVEFAAWTETCARQKLFTIDQLALYLLDTVKDCEPPRIKIEEKPSFRPSLLFIDDLDASLVRDSQMNRWSLAAPT